MVAFHLAAVLQEFREDFRSVIMPVIGRVKIQKNSAARLEAIFEIGHKEIPFSFAPTPIIFPATLKCGREGSNQVKLPAEIRQLFKADHLVNYSIDAEKIDQLIEDRDPAEIKPEAAVPEGLGDEKKETAATTDIQNILRRKPLQAEILRSPDIDPKPLFQIEILRIVPP